MFFEQKDGNSNMQYFFYDGKQWYGVPTYLFLMTHHMNNVNSDSGGGGYFLFVVFPAKNLLHYDTIF